MDSGNDLRNLIIRNVGVIDIPPCTPVELVGIDGTSEPIHKVQLPSAASLNQVIVTGPSTVYAGSFDAIPDSWPRWSAFSGATQPTIGGQVGAAAGTNGMQSGLTGFLCMAIHGSVNTAGTLADDGTVDGGTNLVGGRMLVRPFASAESYSFHMPTPRSMHSISTTSMKITSDLPYSHFNQYGSLSNTATPGGHVEQLIKASAGKYYIGAIQRFTVNGSYQVWQSALPAGPYTSANFPAVPINTNYTALLAASSGGKILVSVPTRSGTLAGTNRQVMELDGTVWGTSLLTAETVYIAPSGESAHGQAGPWQGKIILPNARSDSDISTLPSVDNKYPFYDGTAWDYIPVTRIAWNGGSNYMDNIVSTFVGIEGTTGIAWAVGYKYGTYPSDSGTHGLQKYESAAWSTERRSGTVYAWSRMVATGGGGLLVASSDNSNNQFNLYHLRGGSSHKCGNTLATSAADTASYVGMVAVGDWTGTRVGDVYAAGRDRYDFADGTSLLGAVIKLPHIGGTAHGTWQTYGARLPGIANNLSYLVD